MSGHALRVAAPAAVVLLCALLPSASRADLVVDFETTNPFSGGSLSTVHANSGTQSLFLTAGDTATLAIPGEYLGGPVKVTMMVYDVGRWIDRTVTGYPTSVYGPRWGVSTDDGGPGEYAGVSILEKTSLTSEFGYGYNEANEGRFDSSWWSYAYYGGPRQCTLSANGGTWDGANWTMGTEGTGAWTEWTFEVTAAGVATFYRTGGPQRTFGMGASATEVWLYGGRNHATAGLPLADVYIDDVVITVLPEPATMGLLGLGLVGLAFRRRK